MAGRLGRENLTQYKEELSKYKTAHHLNLVLCVPCRWKDLSTNREALGGPERISVWSGKLDYVTSKIPRPTILYAGISII